MLYQNQCTISDLLLLFSDFIYESFQNLDTQVFWDKSLWGYGDLIEGQPACGWGITYSTHCKFKNHIYIKFKLLLFINHWETDGKTIYSRFPQGKKVFSSFSIDVIYWLDVELKYTDLPYKLRSLWFRGQKSPFFFSKLLIMGVTFLKGKLTLNLLLLLEMNLW